MTRKTKILRAALYILVFGVSIYFVRGFIRLFIVQPLFYVGSYLFLVYTSLPQQLVWSLLILVGVWGAIQALIKIRTPNQPQKDQIRNYPNRVAIWKRWLHLADKGDLYRLKLANEISNLMLSTLANREGQSLTSIRHRVRNGGILLPEKALEMINSPRLADNFNPITKLWRRFKTNKLPPDIYEAVEESVRYLEANLEVQSGKSGH